MIDHFPQNKSEKHKGENKKQKGKQKREGKSGAREGKGKGKDKKQTHKHRGSSNKWCKVDRNECFWFVWFYGITPLGKKVQESLRKWGDVYLPTDASLKTALANETSKVC